MGLDKGEKNKEQRKGGRHQIKEEGDNGTAGKVIRKESKKKCA